MQNPHNIQILRLIKKTAVILMLLYHLNRPSGETEVATLLEMDTGTARTALRSLERAGFVIRVQIQNGYSLTEFGRQLFPFEIGKNARFCGETMQNARFGGETGKNARFATATAINTIPLIHYRDQTVTVKESQTGKNTRFLVDTGKNTRFLVETGENTRFRRETGENTRSLAETMKNKRLPVETEQNARFAPEAAGPSYLPDNRDPPAPASPVEEQPLPDPAVLAELAISGITLNKRTRSLASLPHITPEYIRAHRLQLKAQGKEGKTGLLITILESGIPSPELNSAGHLKGCDCPECAPPGFSSLICPECYTHPCQCGEDPAAFNHRSSLPVSPVLSALLSAGLPDNRITRSLADHPAITPELVSASREELKASFNENDPGKLFLLLEKAAREYERQPG